jgi:hypothetical protein
MPIRFERNKTSTFIVMYSLDLYFLGLSLRNTSKALVIFRDEKRSYVSVWNWIQKFSQFPLNLILISIKIKLDAIRWREIDKKFFKYFYT